MTKTLIGAALVAALSTSAFAETIAFRNPVEETHVNAVSRCANFALAAQVGDAVTTRMFMARPNTFERDPIMRGMVRSDLGAALSVAAFNLGARALFRHSAPGMCAFGALESAMVANNLRVLAR